MPDRAFNALDPLELTRVSPGVGPRDRNTEVVINGRGFPVDEPPFIELDSTRLLEVDVLSGSTITAVVPAGMDEGLHDLRLTRYDGQVALLPNAFEVTGAALQVTAVSPREVPQYTPADISIQGRGFAPETEFSIGGVGLQNVTIESTEVARGTLSASLPPGTYDLVATNETDNARLLDAITVLDNGGARGADSGGCVQAQKNHQSPLYGLVSGGGSHDGEAAALRRFGLLLCLPLLGCDDSAIGSRSAQDSTASWILAETVATSPRTRA